MTIIQSLIEELDSVEFNSKEIRWTISKGDVVFWNK